MRERWQPSAPLANLRKRADMVARVRQFFAARDVLEVETPAMGHATVTDLHLDSVSLELAPGQRRFLQTSPEFAMKRLLAAGSGPIYQLCKVFRRDESGRRHNPEFSMLEWYRPGWDEQQLMDEVEALVRVVAGDRLPAKAFQRISYRDLFVDLLQLDPFLSTDAEVIRRARQVADAPHMQLTRDDALQLLMSLQIEPALQAPVFVTEFPASQAALAQRAIDSHGAAVAKRFELFVKGMELANGYLELTDADEQAARFAADNVARAEAGLPVNPVDEHLLAAMVSGLPDCAGVALGFDRLVMLALACNSLAEVVSFVDERA